MPVSSPTAAVSDMPLRLYQPTEPARRLVGGPCRVGPGVSSGGVRPSTTLRATLSLSKGRSHAAFLVHGACGAQPACGRSRRHDDTTTTTLLTRATGSRLLPRGRSSCPKYQRLGEWQPAGLRRRGSAALPAGRSPSKRLSSTSLSSCRRLVVRPQGRQRRRRRGHDGSVTANILGRDLGFTPVVPATAPGRVWRLSPPAPGTPPAPPPPGTPRIR